MPVKPTTGDKYKAVDVTDHDEQFGKDVVDLKNKTVSGDGVAAKGHVVETADSDYDVSEQPSSLYGHGGFLRRPRIPIERL